jgi:hypothetical protein
MNSNYCNTAILIYCSGWAIPLPSCPGQAAGRGDLYCASATVMRQTLV